MPKLLSLTPAFQLKACDLPDGVYRVGRHPQNQVVISEDSVSLQHGELLVFGAEVIVRDKGSRNGTFVDEQRVTGQSQVKHGQKLRFGNATFLLELAPPATDDSSILTAVVAHRRLMQESQAKAASPTSFPVVFSR